MARRLDDEKHARILEAARTIFGEHGYQETSVKQIADAAGVAPGTLYTYFRNKEELFSEAVEEISKRFMTGMRNISLGDQPFLEKLGGFIEYGFGLIEEIHPLLRGMFSEANRRELLIERVDEFCEFIVGFFEEAENRGVPFGSAASVEARRFNLRMIVSGVLFRAALAPPDSLAEELEGIRQGLVTVMRERMTPEDLR